MRFVVVTKWFTGLGFATRLRDEGHDVELAVVGIDDQRQLTRYARVGDGLVPKRTLAEVMATRDEARDAYFIWDENHSVDENECLRAEGFKVFGGGRYADTMEHDRDACLDFVGRYGLQSPPSTAFTDRTSAIRFLEQHTGTAYVYKPDVGDFGGCAFDFSFVVPLESRAVVETVGRLYPAYREMCYTGFGDANVVVARDGVWFFEKCERFGYNAHPNLFWTLDRDPLGETLAALVDGTFVPNFAPGFGASCTMYMDHPVPGKAITIPDDVRRSVYLIDAYAEGDRLLTAAYADSVLIVNAFGYTMPQAWEGALAVMRYF